MKASLFFLLPNKDGTSASSASSAIGCGTELQAQTLAGIEFRQFRQFRTPGGAGARAIKYFFEAETQRGPLCSFN